MEIKILGTEYKILYANEQEDERLKQCDGYCDFTTKNIVCMDKKEQDIMEVGDLNVIKKKILRHEIIHAFMYESGLWENSFSVQNWSTNEEMTDWFAMQSPKIFKVYKKLNIL